MTVWYAYIRMFKSIYMIYTCIRIAQNINLAPFCMGSLHPMIPDPSWYTSKDKFLADVERIALWSAFLVTHPVFPLSELNLFFLLKHISPGEVPTDLELCTDRARSTFYAERIAWALYAQPKRNETKTSKATSRASHLPTSSGLCHGILHYERSGILSMVSIYSTAAFAKVSCGFFSSGMWYSCSKNESSWVSQGRSLQNAIPASN